MRKNLHLLFLTMLLAVAGVQYSGAQTVANSLAEAKALNYQTGDLNLPQDKVQITGKSAWDVYLWDGETGYRLSVMPSEVGLQDAETGMIVNGTVKGSFSSGYMYIGDASLCELTLGEKKAIVPKSISDVSTLGEPNTNDIYRIEGDIVGYEFVTTTGTLALPNGYGELCDFPTEAYDGSHGFLTGMYDYYWGDNLFKPLTIDAFEEVAQEINTKFAFDARSIAEFKSMADAEEGVAEGVVGKLRLTSGVQVVRLTLDEAATVVDLWNGTDGIRLEGGKALYDLFKDAKAGQSVKGYIIGRTHGNADSKLYYDSSLADWDVTDAASITLGDEGTLTPRNLSFNDLKAADLTKGAFDYVYVSIVGLADLVEGKVVLYDGAEKAASLPIDFTYYTPAEEFDAAGKKGDSKGLLVRNANADGFVLYALADDYFTAAPETEYEIEVNSISDFRAITENSKQVKLNLNGVQLLYKDEYGQKYLLWDGTVGMKLQGGDPVVDLLGGAKEGQKLSGYIIGMSVGNNNMALEFDEYVPGNTKKVWDVRTAAEVSFGDVEPLVPVEASFEDINKAITDNTPEKFYYVYTKIYGKIIKEVDEYDRTNYYFADAENEEDVYSLDTYGPYGSDWAGKYAGLTGYATLFIEKCTWKYNETDPYYLIYSVSADFFKEPVTELTFDASAEDNSAKIDEVYEDIKVTVNNLDVKAGKWNTICLPFDLTAEQIAATFGESAKVYTLTAVDKTGEVASLNFTNALTAGATAVMEAGHPYLVEPASDVTTIELEKATVKPGVVATDVDADYALTGTFDKVALAADGSEFYLTTDSETSEWTLVDGAEVTMPAFSAYVKAPAGTTEVDLCFDGVSTGIVNVADNGAIVSDGRVYNLNGQYVGDSLRGLAKGVYVSGGKKVVVK